MRKIILIILTFILILFLIWLLIPGEQIAPQNRPVKSKNTFSALYLFGLKTVSLSKQWQVNYNTKGRVIEELGFDDNTCIEKHLYLYTKFDSVQKEVSFKGKELAPVEIKTYTYDNLLRPLIKKRYEVRTNNLKRDTFLNESTTHYYIGTNITKVISKTFTERYQAPDYIKPYTVNDGGSIIILRYNNERHLVADTSVIIFDAEIGSKNDTSVTFYNYDNRGHLISKFEKDSLYYKINNRGQVLEEVLKSKDYSRTERVNRYDVKGNLVNSHLSINSGLNYTYKYDKFNKPISECGDTYLLIFMPCAVYHYEYY